MTFSLPFSVFLLCRKHFVDNLPGMKIAFDVLLEAEFEISETDRNTDRYDAEPMG